MCCCESRLRREFGAFCVLCAGVAMRDRCHKVKHTSSHTVETHMIHSPVPYYIVNEGLDNDNRSIRLNGLDLDVL